MKTIPPREAWALLQQNPDAVFIDTRTEIEYMCVGRPPGVCHVAWEEYPDFHSDPAAFVAAVSREVPDKNTPVLLICRSGNRTVEAGKALEAAGFTQVFDVEHGFEGDLDAQFHRSTLNGWRFEGLPWEQF